MPKVAKTDYVGRLRQMQRSSPFEKRCADCTESAPPYVCVDLMTFVCTACSGLHREFKHKVKGISVSHWTDEEITRIEKEGGNERARALYMAEWSPEKFAEPSAEDPHLVKEIISAKYIEKRWVTHQNSDEDETNNSRRKSAKGTSRSHNRNEHKSNSGRISNGGNRGGRHRVKSDDLFGSGNMFGDPFGTTQINPNFSDAFSPQEMKPRWNDPDDPFSMQRSNNFLANPVMQQTNSFGGNPGMQHSNAIGGNPMMQQTNSFGGNPVMQQTNSFGGNPVMQRPNGFFNNAAMQQSSGFPTNTTMQQPNGFSNNATTQPTGSPVNFMTQQATPFLSNVPTPQAMQTKSFQPQQISSNASFSTQDLGNFRMTSNSAFGNMPDSRNIPWNLQNVQQPMGAAQFNSANMMTMQQTNDQLGTAQAFRSSGYPRLSAQMSNQQAPQKGVNPFANAAGQSSFQMGHPVDMHKFFVSPGAPQQGPRNPFIAS